MNSRKDIIMAHDYWNDKDKRSKKASSHTRNMHYKYSKEIAASAVRSIIYDETNIFYRTEKPHTPELYVVPTTTTGALSNLIMNTEKVAVLNFASFKNPGGKFLQGSNAQEESLCHESFLYNVLEMFNATFYERNRMDTNRSLYYNRAIYSPNIGFIDHNNPGNMIYVDVITCAAPNKGAAMKYSNVTEQENMYTLISRCTFVLDVAQANNVDTLILGAFGCGVFKQNPYDVARVFGKLLKSTFHSFKRVVFAIPTHGHSFENYEAFNKVINGGGFQKGQIYTL